MDKKSWFILVLCIIALIYSLNNGVDKKNRADLAKKEQQKILSKQQDNAEFILAATKTFRLEQKLVDLEGIPFTKEFFFTAQGGSLYKVLQHEIIAGKKYTKVILDTTQAKNKQRYMLPLGTIIKNLADPQLANYRLKSTNNQDKLVLEHTSKAGIVYQLHWQIPPPEKNNYDRGIQLQIVIKNQLGKQTINTKDYLLTAGNLAITKEDRPEFRRWFYYVNDEDYNSESNTYFDKGWFSSAKTSFQQSWQKLHYFGVSSQFDMIMIIPEQATTLRSIPLLLPGEEKMDKQVFLGTSLPNKELRNAGDTAHFNYRLYVGKRYYGIVSKLTAGASDSMNYGNYLGFLSPIMYRLLIWLETMITSVTHTFAWGLAIVLLTIIIRIVIWPLHYKSTRSMKLMGKLQPLAAEIRKKYSNDPQRVQRETMQLYRKYGVNPLGGCLPALIQIPIFFGVFGVLNNAAELQGYSFLWVKNLALPDTVGHVAGIPINLLPILMAVTMILQMKLAPSSGDKLQRRLFMLMPIVFFLFCYNYAAALALYWTVQNIVSILQTWLIRKVPEPELVEKSTTRKKLNGKDDTTPRKKGFFEKMVDKLEEAQKLQEAKQRNKKK